MNGEQVKVQADGVDIGLFTVSGGAINIGMMAAVVYAGLPYTGKLQLLPLGDGSPLGTGQTKFRKVYLSALRVYRSLGGPIERVGELRVVHAVLLAGAWPARGRCQSPQSSSA